MPVTTQFQHNISKMVVESNQYLGICPEEGPDGIPTLNKMGFMATTIDEYSEKFVTFATGNVKVLEVGPAFGTVTLEVLRRNDKVKVVALDLEPRHIHILVNSCPEYQRKRLIGLVGDFNKVDLELGSFRAILCARVLHFMDGPHVRKSLAKFFGLLENGGKLVIVADSPYLRDSELFVPEFERRLKSGADWPGLVEDIKLIGSSSAGILPDMFHFLDPHTLKRELESVGFVVEEATYFERKDYPESVKLDGRDCVGVVATKP